MLNDMQISMIVQSPRMSLQHAMMVIQAYIKEKKDEIIQLPITVSNQDELDKFEKAITVASAYYESKFQINSDPNNPFEEISKIYSQYIKPE